MLRVLLLGESCHLLFRPKKAVGIHPRAWATQPTAWVTGRWELGWGEARHQPAMCPNGCITFYFRTFYWVFTVFENMYVYVSTTVWVRRVVASLSVHLPPESHVQR